MGRGYKSITRILEKRYNNEGKIYRFISRSIVSIIREQQSNQNLKHRVRISLLAHRPLNNNDKMLPDCSQIVKSKKKIAHIKQAYIPFFVPDFKSFYEKSKHPEIGSRERRTSTLKLTSTLKNFQLN